MLRRRQGPSITITNIISTFVIITAIIVIVIIVIIVTHHPSSSSPSCCGYLDVVKLKSALEESWVAKADAYLAPHNLKTRIYAVQSDKTAQFGIQIMKSIAES